MDQDARAADVNAPVCHPAMAEIGYQCSLAANSFLHNTVIREPSGWERAFMPTESMRGAEGFAFENQPRWIQKAAHCLDTAYSNDSSTTIRCAYGCRVAASARAVESDKRNRIEHDKIHLRDGGVNGTTQ